MTDLAKKRIFVVEDDVVNIAVIALILKRLEAVVIQDAWNADTINMLIQSLPVNVILLDLMLRKGVNGYDIFDKIKSHPELADIPIVVVSASDPEIEIPRAQAKGFSGFIAKPINFQTFPDQVISCMNGQPVWDTGR